MNQIRPIALCVFHHNNHILVFEGYDKAKAEIFYRPLGGGIEFGEGKSILYPPGLMEMLVPKAAHDTQR